MRIISKPSDDAKDVYLTCISRVRNVDLKSRLESLADRIDAKAEEYDQHGISKSLCTFCEYSYATVTIDEMEKVYTTRMAKKGAPGRPVYDRIKAAAPHAICPLCGHRTVSTLDHYLPKSIYPSLVVVPNNLVPACSDCNKLKLSHVAGTQEGQTMHPYYDDVSSPQWLFAEVIEDAPVSISFYVRPDENCDSLLKDRVKKHFGNTTMGFHLKYMSI